MSHPDTAITPNIVDFDALGRANINGSEAAAQFENQGDHCHLCSMSEEFDPADFSFVVKRRGGPLKPWVWEIYRAGRSGPVKRSSVFFETMAEATKEGKKALLASWQNGLPDVEVVPRVALGEATAHYVTPSGP